MSDNIKLVILGILLVTSVAVYGQGSTNVPLLVNINSYPSVGYNDCWGYTAPDGREYALLGVFNGTSIIDITDPDNAVEVEFIPSVFSIWKDIKTYQHYAYVITETEGGLQIIDLSGLPDAAALTATYTGLSSSHNIFVDESTGILYSEGGNTEPVRVFSLADPTAPVQISSFGIECHDVYVQDSVAYVSEGSRVSYGIYNVSDPANPTLLKRITKGVSGYAHNAWATEDGNYLMTTEETPGKTVKLWDISNLDNIVMADEILASDGLAHNTHIKGDYAYISHYGDGLRIIDISDPYSITETGYYDTYSGFGGGYSGAWGAFPFFASGKVLISDMDTGLYVVFFEGAVNADSLDPLPVQEFSTYSDYATPNSVTLTWIDPVTLVNEDPIPDFSLVIFRDSVQIDVAAQGMEMYVDDGLIDGQYYTYDIFVRLTENDSISFSRSKDVICGGSPIPSMPLDFTGEAVDSAVTLSWTNPSTQIDGTPLDDIAAIKIYRNGEILTEVTASFADTGAVLTFVDVPEFGFSYDYQISIMDNEEPQNESNITKPALFWVGDVPEFLIWNPEGVGDKSAYTLARAFYELNSSVAAVNQLTKFGTNLYNVGYKAIFVLCGFSPDTYEIWDGEGMITIGDLFKLNYYLNDGGSIYMEAGDEFSNGNAVTVTNKFYIDVMGRDINFLENVVGIDGTFTEGMSFEYTGANAGIDVLAPGEDAFAIFSNSAPSYLTGIAYDGGGYRTIGAGFEFGGLMDNEVTKTDLLAEILDFLIDTTSSFIIKDSAIPFTFKLRQNYPNPFNPITTIRYDIPNAGDIQLIIYDILGREVIKLVDTNTKAGYHSVQWDSRDNSGKKVTTGVYIYRLQAGDFVSTRKLLLIK